MSVGQPAEGSKAPKKSLSRLPRKVASRIEHALKKRASAQGIVVGTIGVASGLITIGLSLTDKLQSLIGNHATRVLWELAFLGAVSALVFSLAEFLFRSERRLHIYADGIHELNELKANAEAPVAQAIERFADLSHDAEELQWRCAELEDQDLIDRMQRLLKQLVDAFTVITGLEYRASIKYFSTITTTDGHPYIVAKTLVRSSGLEPLDADDLIFVRDNTAFYEVFFTNASIHFSNDLVSLSSAGLYDNTRRGWQNRYRSAIVWKLQDDKGRFGACCVDSLAVGSFERKRDVNLGWMFVDAIKHVARQMTLRAEPNIVEDLVRSIQEIPENHD